MIYVWKKRKKRNGFNGGSMEYYRFKHIKAIDMI